MLLRLGLCEVTRLYLVGNLGLQAFDSPDLLIFLLAEYSQRLQQLRFGFIEASAQWIPWVFKDIKRRAEGRKLPENFFETYRLYVSCYSSTDDIEYIAQYSTENVLMTGTDYGHVDMSVEIDALRSLEKSGKVRPELARKILYDNPARFYRIQ